MSTCFRTFSGSRGTFPAGFSSLFGKAPASSAGSAAAAAFGPSERGLRRERPRAVVYREGLGNREREGGTEGEIWKNFQCAILLF